MKTWRFSAWAKTLVGLLIAVPLAGVGANRAAAGDRPRLTLTHLSEESLPAAESPGAADLQGAPAAASQPTSSVTPGAASSGTAGAASSAVENPSPAALATPAGALPGGPSASTDSNSPPPALDVSTVNAGRDLASASLAPEIRSAPTPARAASLRFTEDARVQLAAGKVDDALRSLGRAVSVDPDNPYEYFYLGRAYLAKNNYQQALTFFQRAEVGFTPSPDWLAATASLEGSCAEELGRDDAAEQDYRRALIAAPNNLVARVGYSRLAGAASLDPANLNGPPPAAPAALPPPAQMAAPPAPMPDTSITGTADSDPPTDDTPVDPLDPASH